MKALIISTIVLFMASCKSNYYTKGSQVDSDSSVFKSLDSLVQAHVSDTIFYCNSDLIKRVEKITGIKANTDVTYFDKISFTVTDYSHWEAWRNKRTKKNKN